MHGAGLSADRQTVGVDWVVVCMERVSVLTDRLSGLTVGVDWVVVCIDRVSVLTDCWG